MNICAAIFSVFYFGLFVNGVTASLQLVHVFFRHGSRTPEEKSAYPSDPYKIDAFLPMGWGQLTNKGKESAYNLGKKLRNRYDSFLGDIYIPEIIQASSTDVDRTKMTALLVLAGLFPPSPQQKWDNNLNWMPIPIHFDKDKYDYTLRRPTKYCPNYVKELEEVLSSSEVQRTLKAKRKLLQYISKNSKKPMNKLLDVFDLYQTLNAEESMNLTLPEWTKSVYPDEIRALAAKQCVFENHNAILKRLNGGRMLQKVIQNMIEKSNNSHSPPERKIYLYSGHENNVINILAALNLFVAHFPKYTASVIIELHRNDENKNYFVKVFYLRDVNVELEKQKLKDCDLECPLEDFVEITKPHIPGNYTLECNSVVNLD